MKQFKSWRDKYKSPHENNKLSVLRQQHMNLISRNRVEGDLGDQIEDVAKQIKTVEKEYKEIHDTHMAKK